MTSRESKALTEKADLEFLRKYPNAIKINGKWIVPQLALIRLDTRTLSLKDSDNKKAEDKLAAEELLRRKERDRAVIGGLAGAGALAITQFTPLAPYLDAAFFTHGALDMANRYDNNTLAWDGLTAMNLLEMTPLGLKGLGKGVKLADLTARSHYAPYDLYRTIGETKLPLETTGNKTITRLGDLEIDNPNLFYRQDAGTGGAFLTGNTAFVKDGIIYPGRARLEGLTDYSWWNKGKPYLTVNAEHPVGRINGQEMPRIFTTNDPSLIKVRDLNYPIGLWNGKRGFVQLSEYVTPKPVDVSLSTYIYEPGYGYRKVTTPSKTIFLKKFLREVMKLYQ